MICRCEISSEQTVKSDNTELELCVQHRFPTYLDDFSAALDRKEMRVNLPTQTHRDLDESLAYQGAHSDEMLHQNNEELYLTHFHSIDTDSNSGNYFTRVSVLIS